MNITYEMNMNIKWNKKYGNAWKYGKNKTIALKKWQIDCMHRCLYGWSNIVCFERKRNELCLVLINLPQMLNGASSSNKIGCCKNISRDFRHKPRTSCSVIWTDFPGRHFRTKCVDTKEENKKKTISNMNHFCAENKWVQGDKRKSFNTQNEGKTSKSKTKYNWNKLQLRWILLDTSFGRFGQLTGNMNAWSSTELQVNLLLFQLEILNQILFCSFSRFLAAEKFQWIHHCSIVSNIIANGINW